MTRRKLRSNLEREAAIKRLTLNLPLWPSRPEDWVRPDPPPPPAKRGRGRPAKAKPPMSKAEEMVARRKPLYDKFVKKPENARKQAVTTAAAGRVKIGDATRRMVADEDKRLAGRGVSKRTKHSDVPRSRSAIQRARKPRP